ncbi:MAG: porin [Rhodospirillales bacterium]|nr:porin [Rhodospirillales bacterium]
MKKLLYGTTALATMGIVAGMATDASAAEKLKLGLGGYMQQWVVFSNQNINLPAGSNNYNAVDQKHNSEVCFIGETTLDNGLTFGVNVQLEANTDTGDQIDESYMYVSSPSMGRLILGDENNAGYLLHVTAPDGGVSLDSGDLLNIEAFVIPTVSTFDTAVGTTYLRFYDNDSGKITYITPRFAGFQLGGSYIPNFEGGGDDNSSLRACGRCNGFYDGWAGGANYTADFGGFGLQLSAGAMTAKANAGPNTDNLFAWSLGGQGSIAGFSAGFGFAKGEQGRGGSGSAAAGTSQINSTGWTVGAAYEIGPYKVGVDYMRGVGNPNTVGADTSGNQRLDQAVLSGTYTLGPGIRLVGGVFWFNGESEGNTSENDGYGFATGFKLGF